MDCHPPGSSVKRVPRQEHWCGLPFPLQAISPTQESNPHLLHWQDSLSLSHQGSPYLRAERGAVLKLWDLNKVSKSWNTLNRILKEGPMFVILKGGRVGISDWRSIINSKRKIQKKKLFCKDSNENNGTKGTKSTTERQKAWKFIQSYYVRHEYHGSMLRHHTVTICSFCWCSCMFSHVQLTVTLWGIAHQTPLSMEFSRQEYWSGLPFPAPEGLPDPGVETVSPASPALAGGLFTTKPPGKPVQFLSIE